MVVAAHEAIDEIRRLIRDQLRPHFKAWARCRSTKELEADPRYRSLTPVLRRVLETQHAGCFALEPEPARTRYRFLAWNLERGTELDGQLEAFRSHEYLRTCDVLLLTEADVGMARSGNRDVARTLAQRLGLYYAFVPSYLNLTKGSGVEYDVPGENEVGLHGNAILSRYPIRRARPVRLQNGIDKMASREKRLGQQTALVADIDFPNGSVTAASVHLDSNSSQRHRRDQMRDVLGALPGSSPAIIGGDWNTATFDSSSAFRAILGYCLRVLMGPGNVIRNHHLHPYRRFETELFALLQDRGFDYRECNRLGEYTMFYDIADFEARQNLGDWVPGWCFAFIRWALRAHGGRCPLKLDWFAARNLRVEAPVVIHDLREGRSVPLSDHDAIGVDVRMGEA